MKRLVRGILPLALAFGLFPSLAAAATITVSNGGDPAWILLPNSIGNGGAGTWGLPANLSSIGCGTENEPTCEPTGTFVINDTFVTTGYYTILDEDGQTVGDVIAIDNAAPGGFGQILFYSDPNPGVNTTPGTFLGAICTVDVNFGCSGTLNLLLSGGSTLVVEPASDGEAVFDPFGYGFDTSDQIRFSGTDVTVTDGQVPEPASLLLLGTGLAGLGRRQWRKRIGNRRN